LDFGRRVGAKQARGDSTRDGHELLALRGLHRSKVPAKAHEGEGQLSDVLVPPLDPRDQRERPEIGLLLRPTAHRGLLHGPCANVWFVHGGVAGKELGTRVQALVAKEVVLVLCVA
jgi:hypothetical protein